MSNKIRIDDWELEDIRERAAENVNEQASAQGRFPIKKELRPLDFQSYNEFLEHTQKPEWIQHLEWKEQQRLLQVRNARIQARLKKAKSR